MTFCLSIHSLMDIWIVSALLPVRITLWTFVVFCGHTYYREECCLYIGLGLLDHIVCLNFWGTTRLLSKWLPYYISASRVWGFQSLHTLADTWWFALHWWLMMLSMFHMFINPLWIFLGEMFIQVLYPLFDWLSFFKKIEL